MTNRALLIASVLSFMPQIHRMADKQSASGVSLMYTLLNLISVTEQFCLVFLLVVNDTEGSDMFVHNPVNGGDWLNLIQLGILVLLWLLL